MMTEDDFPVGETRIIEDNGIVKQIYTRTNEDDGVYRILDSQNDNQVFKALTSRNSNKNSRVVYIDFDFWTIKVDGEVAENIPPSSIDRVIDPEKKIISFSTK